MGNGTRRLEEGMRSWMFSGFAAGLDEGWERKGVTNQRVVRNALSKQLALTEMGEAFGRKFEVEDQWLGLNKLSFLVV